MDMLKKFDEQMKEIPKDKQIAALIFWMVGILAELREREPDDLRIHLAGLLNAYLAEKVLPALETPNRMHVALLVLQQVEAGSAAISAMDN